MGTLIDSSVLIAAERGKIDFDVDVLPLVESDGEVAISALTASELLTGMHLAPTQKIRVRQEAAVEAYLARLPSVPFDLLAARVHAKLRADLQAAGVSVGLHDLLIAATALSRGYQVLTRDGRSFPRIPALTVVMC